MRVLVCALCALAACGGEPAAVGATRPALQVLHARPLPDEAKILVDGRISDPAWQRIQPLVVPLEGDGVGNVKLKAAYDGEFLYLLAVWPDATQSFGRYWEYVALAKWKKHTGEDGFSICWAPGGLNQAFREQGCTLFCHGGKHSYTASRRGLADFWYWGAQTTGRKPNLRDMWMPFGQSQRLRGDSQPDGSDNLPNLSEEYEGPWGVPKRVGPRRSPYFLDISNVQRLKLERLTEKLEVDKNLGWKVALDIQQPIKGSRGDVLARAKHLGTAWVLEMARRARTNNKDDLPLGDTSVPVYFSVAVHEAAEKQAHSVSKPIELRFVPRR